MNKTVKYIVNNAIIASIYFILTFAFPALSFGPIQFRIGEILLFICLFNSKYIYGITIGTILSNIVSPLGIIDVFVGTSATVLSLVISLVIIKKNDKLDFIIIPISSLFNGVLIGLEYYFIYSNLFFITFIQIFLSELVVLIVGYIIYRLFKNNKNLRRIL